jgi:broad specificity phosphatase PhoE
MKICLVRHGQTEENFLHKIQGLSNNLMNDTGRRQCQVLRGKLKGKHFDYCYMSPLVRCVETAFILVGDVCETIPDKRLVERNFGELEGRLDIDYNEYQFWNYTLNRSDFGIEPIHDVFKRCEEFLDYIISKHHDETILIVTHSSPYRALRHLIKKSPLKGQMLDGLIDNCQYEEFEID